MIFFLFYSGNECRLFGHPFQVNVSSVQENGTVIGVVRNPRASSEQGFWKNCWSNLHLIYVMAFSHKHKETPKIILAFSQEFETWMWPMSTQQTFQRVSLGFGLSVSFSLLCKKVLHFTEWLSYCCCLLNVARLNAACEKDLTQARLGSSSWVHLCSSVKSKYPLIPEITPYEILFYFIYFILLYCIVLYFLKWF